MKLAAAYAIAELVTEPSADRIVPSVFQEGVAEAVASGGPRARDECRPGATDAGLTCVEAPTRPTGRSLPVGRQLPRWASPSAQAAHPACVGSRPDATASASEGAAASLGDSSGSMSGAARARPRGRAGGCRARAPGL